MQGTLARAIAADIGIAAFEEAVKGRPHRNLMVRSGMHVFRQRASDPPRSTPCELNDGLPSVLDVWFQLME